MFLCLCKTHFILFILLTTSIFFCFCVLPLLLLFSDLNFTLHIASTTFWVIFIHISFLIAYRKDKLCINPPYFLFSDPLMRTIVDHASNVFFFILNVSSASSTSLSLFINLVVLNKLSKTKYLIELLPNGFLCCC